MHHEMALHVEAGIPPLEVIKMATHNAAKILRHDADYGSIEVGKVADLVIVDGDPSTDISHMRKIKFVLKGGKIIDRAALRAQ